MTFINLHFILNFKLMIRYLPFQCNINGMRNFIIYTKEKTLQVNSQSFFDKWILPVFISVSEYEILTSSDESKYIFLSFSTNNYQ